MIASVQTERPAAVPDRRTRAAQDFEALLVANWLGKMLDTVSPDDAQDSSSATLRGVAVQAIASAVTRTGGFGIARLIEQHLPEERSVVPPGTLVPEVRLKSF